MKLVNQAETGIEKFVENENLDIPKLQECINLLFGVLKGDKCQVHCGKTLLRTALETQNVDFITMVLNRQFDADTQKVAVVKELFQKKSETGGNISIEGVRLVTSTLQDRLHKRRTTRD